MRLEGLFQWKIPITPMGIEPATLRLVEQCLNHLVHQGQPLHLQIHFLSRWVFPIQVFTGKYILFFSFFFFFCEGQTAYIEVQKICLIPSLRSLLEFDLPEIKWYSRVSLCVPTDPNCSIVQCKPLTWRQNMKLQKGIGVLWHEGANGPERAEFSRVLLCCQPTFPLYQQQKSFSPEMPNEDRSRFIVPHSCSDLQSGYFVHINKSQYL